jgi:hypothetical protein
MKIEKSLNFGATYRPKGVIFGSEGSGKSTIGSKLSKVLFLDVESGIAGLDVDSVKIGSWNDFVNTIKEIVKEVALSYDHIVVDSLTALERLLHQHICNESGSSSIVLACGGYGKGLVEAVTKLSLLMNQMANRRDLGFWFLCHSQVKSVNDPTRGEYASFQVRADKALAEWVTSWADLVGFVEIDLMVSDDGKPVIKKEGSEVRRTITVTPRSGLVAKSRIPALSGILSVDSFVTKVNEIFSNTKKEGK